MENSDDLTSAAKVFKAAEQAEQLRKLNQVAIDNNLAELFTKTSKLFNNSVAEMASKNKVAMDNILGAIAKQDEKIRPPPFRDHKLDRLTEVADSLQVMVTVLSSLNDQQKSANVQQKATSESARQDNTLIIIIGLLTLSITALSLVIGLLLR